MQAIFEVKHGRTGYLILSFFALFFCLLFTWLGFFFKGPINADNFTPVYEIPIGQTIGCSIGIIVSGFLLLHWVGRLIKNPSVFTIYLEGFESNTNGVSSGFIQWKDVASLKDVTVDINSRSGLRKEAALAVYLKNTDEYINQRPALLRFLLKLARWTGQYQLSNKDYGTQKEFPILVPANTFGNNYEKIKEKIVELSGLRVE